MTGAILDTIGARHVTRSSERAQYPVGEIHPTSDPERPRTMMPRCNRDIVLIYSTYSVGANLACRRGSAVLALSTSGDKLFTTATDRERMQDSDSLSRGQRYACEIDAHRQG